jgi:hypothetical protein
MLYSPENARSMSLSRAISATCWFISSEREFHQSLSSSVPLEFNAFRDFQYSGYHPPIFQSIT